MGAIQVGDVPFILMILLLAFLIGFIVYVSIVYKQSYQQITVETISPYTVPHNYSQYALIDADRNRDPQSWEEFVKEFQPKYRGHVQALKKYVESNKLVGTRARDINHKCFQFSDGEIWALSNDAWAELMQSIINKREGYAKYL